MFKIIRTTKFDKWLSKIKDSKIKTYVLAKLEHIKLGNIGDYKSVGGGVCEIRIHIGAGIRLYFMFRDSELIILLCAGDKSTQSKDIMQAKQLAKQIRSKNV